MIKKNQIISEKALEDILLGFKKRRVWWRLAYTEILEQYQRTLIGPFWITIGTLIMVLTFGILYAKLLGMEISEHLPYVAIGLVFWHFMQSVIIQGCEVFSRNAGMIKQIPLPLSVYVYQLCANNIIILGHNFIIVFCIILFQLNEIGFETLLFIPALFVVILLCLSWIIIAGILSTRYRDVPQIVQGILRPAMFVTPVIWHADSFGDRRIFIELNPFYHILSVLREPLLGRTTPLLNWIILFVMLILSVLVAGMLYTKYRRRIAFWV